MLADGTKVGYESLVVAAGLQISESSTGGVLGLAAGTRRGVRRWIKLRSEAEDDWENGPCVCVGL